MKINITDAKKIDSVLDKLQSRCNVNCVDSANLIEMAGDAEEQCRKNNINKAWRNGIKLHYHAAGPAASSYRYRQGATAIELTKGATCWFLTRAYRTSVGVKSPECYELTLPEKTKKNITDRLQENFCKI